MPKNLSKIEIYATSFFALFYGKTVDEILDVKKNWYGFFKTGVQYMGVLSQIVIYPTVSLLFLNYFPFSKKKGTKIFYIIGWSLFAIIFERISLKTKFFYYTKWRTLYSVILYPFIFLSLVGNLKLVRNLIRMLPR